jgi:hypothetical protein
MVMHQMYVTGDPALAARIRDPGLPVVGDAQMLFAVAFVIGFFALAWLLHRRRIYHQRPDRVHLAVMTGDSSTGPATERADARSHRQRRSTLAPSMMPRVSNTAAARSAIRRRSYDEWAWSSTTMSSSQTACSRSCARSMSTPSTSNRSRCGSCACTRAPRLSSPPDHGSRQCLRVVRDVGLVGEAEHQNLGVLDRLLHLVQLPLHPSDDIRRHAIADVLSQLDELELIAKRANTVRQIVGVDAARNDSQTSIPKSCENTAISLTNAMFTCRYVFSKSFDISATRVPEPGTTSPTVGSTTRRPDRCRPRCSR